ncbi:membrane peptidoglycan carboxypeptidase [Allocatelliglobosispora scoriae]|uniref:Membrane peptidoglycan carboxypeptidase n=1 Tax=Allocatelliglobosispora scoriae TaxID=643052 RepID=A0A841BZQ0_9ACTN|nr:transglycosylase domain-containing protein [Allocatelliglobosispora scoriae]MBB5872373.1 membrane peptidoglycan carboxypeptidase [Allocatelliglobosispora scoriae]
MSSYGDHPSGPGRITEYDDQPPRAVVDDRTTGRHAARPDVLRSGVPSADAVLGADPAPPAAEQLASPAPGRLAGLRRFARTRRKRILIVSGIVLALVVSTTTVVTYYLDSVDMLDPKNLATQTTKIFGSDGKTQIAQLGTENREDIPMSSLSTDIRNALIAGEDKDFYDHSGVSFTGIARAAWNNVTGGDTQGASTITQQYVKIATKDVEMSVFRKMREAVLARKLEGKYSKEEILGFYLNNVYFGRGAIGVQVASKTFFGKNAKDLSIAEAAVLGAVVRQPEQTPSFAGYDPQLNAEAAKDRWSYVLDNMVDAGWLDESKRSSLAYPTSIAPIRKDAGNAQWGVKGVGLTGMTTGNVLNYVVEELKAAPYGITDLKTGGYRITTTINPKIQAAAESAARRGASGSLMNGQKANLMAALVAVEPKTGRVLAYYGGDDGTGHDYAGLNMEGGALNGGHPGGSSFKVYTLAAALKAGYSLASHFDPAEFRDGDFRIQNAGRDVDSSCGNYCTLEWATVHSYNVPFYKISKLVGVDKVVASAKAAGIRTMWSTGRKGELIANDLTSKTFKQTSNAPFYYQAGFGQYPITVLDHATGMATFANRGVYNASHFVLKVERPIAGTDKYQLVGGEKLKPAQTIDKDIADDVNWVLQKIPPTNGHSLSGGRPAAGKTGTWQCANTSHNCHAWYVGHTKQIAAAVWVGNTGKEQAVYEKSGRDISGAGLPGAIWEKFMNAAHKGMAEQSFADKAGTGNPNKNEPGLVEPRKPEKCWLWFCMPETRPTRRPPRPR